MVRFVRLTFASIVAFALILLGVRWIGSTQPLPSADLWNAIFTNPDGSPCQRPCMFGIQPGVTRFDDAVDMLKAHSFIKLILANEPNTIESEDSRNFWIQANALQLVLERDNQDVSILEIHQLDSYHLLSGEVLERLGSPDHIMVHQFAERDRFGNYWTDISFVYLTWQLGFIIAFPTQDVAKPQGIVTEIYSIDTKYPECDRTGCPKWQGFKLLSDYPEFPLHP